MMKQLLLTTAVLEAGTGIGLLLAPSVLARLLLGATLDAPAALTVARVGGAALVAIGVACWMAREDGSKLIVALLFYNAAAVGILAYAALGLALHGIGLWPAIGLHAVMAVWCVTQLKLTEPHV